jgi:uncharacterized protein YggL (DUF469 family)
LRKKLRLAEFKQMGFTVLYQLKPDLAEPALADLLDRFILDAIEANDLHCGGGGSPEGWDFIVCANGRRSSTEADRERVREWLEGRPEVRSVVIGPLWDMWHGEDGAQDPPGEHAA